MRAWGVFATVVVAVTMITGCTATAEAKPITLTIGTDDRPGVPAATQIQEFAKQVKRMSQGAITIKPRWHAEGDVSDWDQAVATMVRDHKLDMGLIPSRAWASFGVTSLEPLEAPFVITTDQALNTVIAQQGKSLMSGLPKIGVEGIAMYPEGLRRLFGFDSPILTADALAEKTVRAPTSVIPTAVFKTLGAKTDQSDPDPSIHVARDSSFLLVAGGSGPATGNIVLYPKVNVLVIARKSADSLTEGQRRVLDRAAAATFNEILRTQPSDIQAARKFCDQGGTIVDAPESEVSKFRTATASVDAEIAAHSDNAARLSAIRRIAAKAAAAPVQTCASSKTQPTGDQSRLNGVYRFSWTPEEYRAAGVTDEQYIRNNDGVWTWTLKDDTFTMHQIGQVTDTVTGKFWLVGDSTIFLLWPGYAPESYSYTRDPQGNLRLTAIVDEKNFAITNTAKPWERIG